MALFGITTTHLDKIKNSTLQNNMINVFDEIVNIFKGIMTVNSTTYNFCKTQEHSVSILGSPRTNVILKTPVNSITITFYIVRYIVNIEARDNPSITIDYSSISESILFVSCNNDEFGQSPPTIDYTKRKITYTYNYDNQSTDQIYLLFIEII